MPLELALSATIQWTSQENCCVSSHETPHLLGTLRQEREFSIIKDEQPPSSQQGLWWLTYWGSVSVLSNEKPSAHVLCQYVIQSSQRGAGLAQGYLRINFNVWRKENLAKLAFSFLLDCSSSSLPLHLEEDVETVLQRLFCESRKGRNRSRPSQTPIATSSLHHPQNLQAISL